MSQYLKDLVTEIKCRFRVPPGGGRATDMTWTEYRLVRLKPETLARLARVAKAVTDQGATVGPMQLGAILLEQALDQFDHDNLPPAQEAVCKTNKAGVNSIVPTEEAIRRIKEFMEYQRRNPPNCQILVGDQRGFINALAVPRKETE